MAIALVSLFVFYIFLLLGMIIALGAALKGDQPGLRQTTAGTLVSIIIAARNEEQNIGLLLHDILQQGYGNFEVIIVDDHSDDGTSSIVKAYMEKDLRFSLLPNHGTGKKEALTRGIRSARGSLIITTDADCRVTENWVAGLTHYFSDGNTKMVFGGVKMNGVSLFTKLQSLEFVSLMGSAVATTAMGSPAMCNGANLAFRKSVFEEVDGYSGNIHIPSGDDEFLMRKVLKQYSKGVKVATDPDTIVTTAPNKDIKHFIHQRIRWAGKWRFNQSVTTKVLALYIFTLQCTFILLPVFILLHWIQPLIVLAFWGVKVFLEFFFLRNTSRFLRVSWSWTAFILLQFIYPVYAVVIGLLSNFRPFEWKGRKLKSLTISHN